MAKPEDEVMWLESALSMAVKDLDRKIRNEVGMTYTKLRFCLSEDQAAVVEYALAGIDNQLFVSKYQLELPKREEMQRFLAQQMKAAAGYGVE